MPSARSLTSPLRLFALAFLAALSLSGLLLASAQNMRFAPVLYNETAVTGTSSQTNQLSGPQGIATDLRGNLYIADTGHRVIRKVDPTQTATIIAGNGGFGYTGDNGLAISASFNSPSAIAVDPAGNIYVSDTYNFAVRRISPGGLITTFAGGNGSGSSGDTGLATAAQIQPGALAADRFGNVYVVDIQSARVRRITASGIINTFVGGGSLVGTAADGGPGYLAQLGTPSSLAVDLDGNVYIGDDGTSTVRKANIVGTITTFAGTSYGTSGDGGPATTAQIGYPRGLSVDPDGNVYIADYTSLKVRMVNSSGVISTVAGAGTSTPPVLDGTPADVARFNYPSGVAADTNGNLFVLVTAANALYRVALHPERFPQTKVGVMSAPQRLVLENYGATNIAISSILFSGDFHLSSTSMPQSQPCSINTTLYSGFSTYCTLDVVFTPTAEGIRAFPLTVSSNDTPATIIQTLTSTGLGSALALTSGQMFIVAGSGGTVTQPPISGPATSLGLNGVNGLAVDSSGNLFFSQAPFCQIYRIDGNTGNTTVFAGKSPQTCNGAFNFIDGDGGLATNAILNGVGPMAFDAHNNLFIVDSWDGRVRKIDPSGFISAVAGKDQAHTNAPGGGFSGDNGSALDAELYLPGSLAFDSAGNLFIADTGNNVIRRVSTSGTITTVAGNHALGAGFSGDGGLATSAQLNRPMGIVVDSAGNLYIADTQNNIIRKVDANTGNIFTIAGFHGVQGYSGDGGAAVAALLYLPMGLAIDAAGDIFIADTNNMVVRKIDTSGIITTVAGNNLVYDGYNGDGHPATATALAFPNYLALSSSGFLFVSEASNQVIREMSPNGALLFPPQGVGTTSAPQTVTVSNIGNMPLHFDSQFPTGITGDFALVSGGNCDFTGTLIVGASCNVNITFTPTTAGSRYGVFGFFDDGVASPQYVSLSGTGVTAQPQTIHINPIPDKVYGNPSFTVSATATSGLPVSFALLSGPATVSGSTVTITGTGPVVIVASQAGNSSYLPAGLETVGFNVNKANLSVVALNANSNMGSPLSPLTYSITGFAYGETKAVLTGTPTISTTATSSSTFGTYPITIGAGTLSSHNYTFTYLSGVYTILKPPVITLVTTVLFTGVPDHGGYVAYVTIKNTGNGVAPNVLVLSDRVGAIPGNPFNVSYGDIAPGASVTKTFGFGENIGSPGGSIINTVVGNYTGGTFGGSAHVTLP